MKSNESLKAEIKFLENKVLFWRRLAYIYRTAKRTDSDLLEEKIEDFLKICQEPASDYTENISADRLVELNKIIFPLYDFLDKNGRFYQFENV